MKHETSLPNWLGLSSALLVVAANVALDHYAAPAGLTWSLVVAPLATWLVLLNTTRWCPYVAAGLCALLLALQDVGFRLWGGGMHDLEGQGVLMVLLLVGALLSAGVMFWSLWRRGNRWYHQLGAVGLFILLLVSHLQLFGEVGYGLYYER